MINLLPQEAKERIVRERFFRFFIFACSFLAVLLVAGMIPLFVFWFALHAEERSLITHQEVLLKAPALARAADIESELGRFNNMLRLFEQNQRKVLLPSPLFKKIISHRNGIRIDSFAFDAKRGDAPAQFRLEGTARDRDALLAFIDSLEREPDITNVRSPLSNLLRGSDTEFLLTFDIAPGGVR